MGELKIEVAVVAAQLLVREALQECLSLGVVRVGCAAPDVEELLRGLGGRAPDLAVVDLDLGPRTSWRGSAALLKQLRESLPEVPLVGLLPGDARAFGSYQLDAGILLDRRCVTAEVLRSAAQQVLRGRAA